MLSFSHASVTRLTLHMAALLSASRPQPSFAAVDGRPRMGAKRRDRADHARTVSQIAPIFQQLPEGPAARAREPDLDWLQVAVHYRPVP